ncbi:hypothetical protein RQP46_000340 [Phenoliferia psychrophenolica]
MPNALFSTPAAVQPLDVSTVVQISDMFLTNLSNSLGALAVLGIVVFQWVEINTKREKEARLRDGLDTEEDVPIKA